MVQVLPRFDPGAEIGRGLGQGIGQGAEQVVDRQRLLGGLSALQNLNFDNMSTGDVISTLSKSFVGIPGGMQVLETLLPKVLAERKGRGAANLYSGAGGAGIQQPEQQLQNMPNVQPGEGVAGEFGKQAQFTKQGQATSGNIESPTQLRGPGSINQQEYPELDVNRLIYEPPSMQEIGRKRQELTAQGVVGPEQDSAIQKWEDTRKSYYEAARETQERREKSFKEQRALSENQDAFVTKSAAHEIGVSENELDPYELDKARSLFQKNKEKSINEGKNLSDQQLWRQSRKDFNSLRESLKAGEKLFRPDLLSPDKRLRTKNNKRWAQNHLKSFGDEKQDRDKLISLFMQNGYTRTEADSFVKPFSNELNSAVNSLNKLPEIEKSGFMKAVTPKQKEQMVRNKESYLNSLPEKLAKSISNKDSILLLRDTLVRDKNLTEDDFMNVLDETKRQMEKEGKSFTPEQLEELPDLNKRVTPSLYEWFFEKGENLKKWFPIGAK